MWPKSEFFHHIRRNMNENSYFCITYKRICCSYSISRREMRKDIIMGIIIGLVMGGLACLFPQIWGLLLLIALVYWIVIFFRWFFKV